MPGEKILVIDDSPTILKVVQLVLSKAGYLVTVAADGEIGVQAAKEDRPDLILLDFVMPVMNGYQVCRALGETPELRDVPVVLMSAKGDQVGERFVKVMGIVDYITKPFSPDAIITVVDHTLAKYVKGGQAPEGSGVRPAPAPDEETSEPKAPEEATSPRMTEQARRRKAALDALRDSVLRAAGAAELGEEAVAKIRAKIGEEALELAVKEIAPAVDPQVVLQGELVAVPLVEVLGLLQQQQQTGVLTIVRDPARVEVLFRGGKVDFAASGGLGEEFLLGRYLIAEEAISKQDFDLFLQSRGSSAKLIGEQLVKLNYIAEPALKRALARQSAERIYEVLRWAGGRFFFKATLELGPLADGARLGLTIDGLLMEGLRRIDEWHLIEREIDDFETVFLRNEDAVREMGRAQLTRDELVVLELVSGKNSVKDIVRLSRMSSFDVSKMLFRLRSIRLIRRRVAPVAV
jgi:CheY-like chemotaxis protein